MNKNIITALLLVIASFLVYALFLRTPESKSGKMAPDIEAELIDGSKFKLKQLRGKYVLLDFWGSWCAPCRRDNPNLVKLYQEFGDKSFSDAKGFEIVTVALEKTDRHWQKAAERDGFIWPYQIVQQAKIVLMSPVAQSYAVKEIPAKFLINPEGEIIAVNQKYEEIRDFLASKVQ